MPTTDGKRAAAIEVLLGTPTVHELIKRGEINGLKDVMEKSEIMGMQTFDTALFSLYKEGRISLEEALKNADSPNNLRLRINLDAQGDKTVTSSGVVLELEDVVEPEPETEEGKLDQRLSSVESVDMG